MTAELEEAPPSLFEHLCIVYQKMRERAVLQMLDDGTEAYVYDGYLTGLYSELGLATPYYTKIQRRLRLMGCAKQAKRGGGAAMSRWILLREPNFDDFVAVAEEAESGKVPTAPKAVVEQQGIADLSQRVTALEDWQEKLMEALQRGGDVGNLGGS